MQKLEKSHTPAPFLGCRGRMSNLSVNAVGRFANLIQNETEQCLPLRALQHLIISYLKMA